MAAEDDPSEGAQGSDSVLGAYQPSGRRRATYSAPAMPPITGAFTVVPPVGTSATDPGEPADAGPIDDDALADALAAELLRVTTGPVAVQDDARVEPSAAEPEVQADSSVLGADAGARQSDAEAQPGPDASVESDHGAGSDAAAGSGAGADAGSDADADADAGSDARVEADELGEFAPGRGAAIASSGGETTGVAEDEPGSGEDGVADETRFDGAGENGPSSESGSEAPLAEVGSVGRDELAPTTAEPGVATVASGGDVAGPVERLDDSELLRRLEDDGDGLSTLERIALLQQQLELRHGGNDGGRGEDGAAAEPTVHAAGADASAPVPAELDQLNAQGLDATANPLAAGTTDFAQTTDPAQTDDLADATPAERATTDDAGGHDQLMAGARPDAAASAESANHWSEADLAEAPSDTRSAEPAHASGFIDAQEGATTEDADAAGAAGDAGDAGDAGAMPPSGVARSVEDADQASSTSDGQEPSSDEVFDGELVEDDLPGRTAASDASVPASDYELPGTEESEAEADDVPEDVLPANAEASDAASNGDDIDGIDDVTHDDAPSAKRVPYTPLVVGDRDREDGQLPAASADDDDSYDAQLARLASSPAPSADSRVELGIDPEQLSENPHSETAFDEPTIYDVFSDPFPPDLVVPPPRPEDAVGPVRVSGPIADDPFGGAVPMAPAGYGSGDRDPADDAPDRRLVDHGPHDDDQDARDDERARPFGAGTGGWPAESASEAPEPDRSEPGPEFEADAGAGSGPDSDSDSDSDDQSPADVAAGRPSDIPALVEPPAPEPVRWRPPPFLADSAPDMGPGEPHDSFGTLSEPTVVEMPPGSDAAVDRGAADRVGEAGDFKDEPADRPQGQPVAEWSDSPRAGAASADASAGLTPVTNADVGTARDAAVEDDAHVDRARGADAESETGSTSADGSARAGAPGSDPDPVEKNVASEEALGEDPAAPDLARADTADEKPADQGHADQFPADLTPADQAPVGQNPADAYSAGQNPADADSADQDPADADSARDDQPATDPADESPTPAESNPARPVHPVTGEPDTRTAEQQLEDLLAGRYWPGSGTTPQS